MSEITLAVRAKINLSLGIRGVDNRGYHDLDMLLSSVEDIYDTIRVYDSESVSVTMDGVAGDTSNTAYKALDIIRREFSVTMSADITKGVPFSAGLGGSSCDAAGVFCAFQKLHGVRLESLTEYADMVGSDVAFMMRGGAAISRGQGSELTFVDIPSLDVVVIKAKGGSNTGEVFKKSDSMATLVRIDNNLLVSKIRQGKEYASLMNNQLYSAASGLNSEIKRIFDECKKVTDYVVMSGSGSSIVVVIHNKSELRKIEEIARSAEYYKVTRTTPYGMTLAR